jgi:hypothetical protein
MLTHEHDVFHLYTNVTQGLGVIPSCAPDVEFQGIHLQCDL